MSKLNIKKLLKTTQKGLSKHGPKILTGLGIAGMGTTVILAVKATPKAMQLIEEKKKEEEVDELSPVVVVKTAYKPYIPAVVLGISTAACLIGANTVSTRRTAALATAYKVTETALSEYKDKVTKIMGEEKAQEVSNEATSEQTIENANIMNSESANNSENVSSEQELMKIIEYIMSLPPEEQQAILEEYPELAQVMQLVQQQGTEQMPMM